MSPSIFLLLGTHPASPSNEVGPWSKPRDGFAVGTPRRGWRSSSVSVLQSYGVGPPSRSSLCWLRPGTKCWRGQGCTLSCHSFHKLTPNRGRKGQGAWRSILNPHPSHHHPPNSPLHASNLEPFRLLRVHQSLYSKENCLPVFLFRLSEWFASCKPFLN